MLMVNFAFGGRVGSTTSFPTFDSHWATNDRKDRESFLFLPVSGGFSGRAAATEAAREGGRAPAFCYQLITQTSIMHWHQITLYLIVNWLTTCWNSCPEGETNAGESSHLLPGTVAMWQWLHFISNSAHQMCF